MCLHAYVIIIPSSSLIILHCCVCCCVVVHVNPLHMPFFNSCRPDKSHRRQRRISLFGDLYAHSPDLTCLGDRLDMKFTPPPRNKGARSEMSKRGLISFKVY